MTIIATAGDLRVHEWASGYEIEHVPTGLRHWMSDGVDMFYVDLPVGRAFPVSPGTEHFNWRMEEWLKSNPSELIEAYFPQLLEPRTHFIAMGGMRGYMPNFCEVFWDRSDAIEYACDIHELGHKSKSRAELKKWGIADLKQKTHGNEYMEVQKCECLEPWIHSEEGMLEWE